MKKRSAIILTLLTVLLCAALITGATFALFGMSVPVGVTINSGNLRVTAELGSLATNSMGKDQQNGSFELGGSAQITEKGLVLTGVVPGDEASVTLTVANESSIAVIYRIRLRLVSGTAGDLCAEVNGQQYELSESAVTVVDWNTQNPLRNTPGENTAEIAISVSLPQSAGNANMLLDGGIEFIVDAVQANADPQSDGFEENFA